MKKSQRRSSRTTAGHGETVGSILQTGSGPGWGAKHHESRLSRYIRGFSFVNSIPTALLWAVIVRCSAAMPEFPRMKHPPANRRRFSPNPFSTRPRSQSGGQLQAGAGFEQGFAGHRGADDFAGKFLDVDLARARALVISRTMPGRSDAYDFQVRSGGRWPGKSFAVRPSDDMQVGNALQCRQQGAFFRLRESRCAGCRQILRPAGTCGFPASCPRVRQPCAQRFPPGPCGPGRSGSSPGESAWRRFQGWLVTFCQLMPWVPA